MQSCAGGVAQVSRRAPWDEPCWGTSLNVRSLGSTAPEAPPKLDLLQTPPYCPVPRRSQAFHSAVLAEPFLCTCPGVLWAWGCSQSSAVSFKNDPWCEENSKCFPGAGQPCQELQEQQRGAGCRCCCYWGFTPGAGTASPVPFITFIITFITFITRCSTAVFCSLGHSNELIPFNMELLAAICIINLLLHLSIIPW